MMKDWSYVLIRRSRDVIIRTLALKDGDVLVTSLSCRREVVDGKRRTACNDQGRVNFSRSTANAMHDYKVALFVCQLR